MKDEKILEELSKLCSGMSDREELEFYRRLKSISESKISDITTSEDGHNYNVMFRGYLNYFISERFPNSKSWEKYNEYTKLRAKIVKNLNLSSGTVTKMMTESEYKKCMQCLRELDNEFVDNRVK